MKRTVISVLAVLVLVSGCSNVPTDDIQVQAEADPKANFGGYETYAWIGGVGIVNDPGGYWEPPQFDADAEIEFLIDKALRARGFSEVDRAPDTLVGYALGVDMAALELDKDPETKITMLKNVPQSALVVTLIDPASGRVIWAGVAEAEFKNLEPDAAKQRLKYAINAMFNRLPM